jgi:hypothetical protein
MALTLDGTSGIISSGAISSSSNITATGSITTQSATGIIFSDSSNQGAAASPFSLKNRIINGDMVIDQRNAGASVTPTNGSYGLDRWTFAATQASKFTAQQNAGAVTPPAGFSNYLGITSTSAYSITAGDIFYVRQPIEGFNTADLAFGTANARTVTLSFWVRSSLTGAFGGALQNSAENRSYPFSYTISAANTWEYKTVTITGDTSGTWVGATNGIGMSVIFGLGVGSTFTGPAGSWLAAQDFAPNGATSVVGTNGATFYITGVQLERNTTATPFEWLPYGTELMLCQRYYEKGYDMATAPANAAVGYFDGGSLATFAYATNNMRSVVFQFCVEKRAAPTITLYNTGIGGISANFWAYYNGSAWANYNSAAGASVPTAKSFSVRSTSSSSTGVAYMIEGNWAASSEL